MQFPSELCIIYNILFKKAGAQFIMSSNRHYITLGLTAFLTVAAILLFYDTLFGSHAFQGFWDKLFSAVSPIILGAFMAYMLTPMVNFFERLFFYVAARHAKRGGLLSGSLARGISIFLVWAVVAVIVFLLLSVLLPELYRSIVQLASNMQAYYNTIDKWITMLFERFPEAESWMTERLEDAYTQIDTYIQSAMSSVQTLMAAAGRGFLNVMNFLKNLLIGMIVSIYLLSTKERVAATSKRFLCGMFSQETVGWILRAVGKANQIFSGFVRGKLMDSLIIGLLCFVGCAILNFPYTSLIAVFVGITNMIPFFGPFIGAIPSAFLILLISPIQALYFAVFILALQQLDGNVIGPKILGDQTGLSSLGVMIGILIGGSFFGIPGMFFGVPVLACISSACVFLIESRLKSRKLPVEISAYAKKSRSFVSPDKINQKNKKTPRRKE